MFSIISRSIPRRTLVQSARYYSKKPPVPPSPPKKKIKPTPQRQPETKATSAEEPTPKVSEPIPEPEQPAAITGVPTLDFSPPGTEQEYQRTGARSSKGSLSSSERKRRFASRVSLGLLALAFGAGAVYMGREWEPEELAAKKKKIEDAPSTRWARTKERFTGLFGFFVEPAWPELLPPPYPPPHQKPYTLLLSIDDLLVTSTWDRKNGWRTAKRPGVDYFLAYISQFYEVVIFTTQPSYTASPILDKLDRYNFYINYRLFREATRTLNGKIVKDLSYLNRDLSKVVMIDTDPEHVSTHPENTIILPKWKGDPKDKNLVAMIPFLESIAIYKPGDVRPILQRYAGKDIPLEYGKVEAEMKAKHIAEWQAKHKNSAGSGFSFGALLGMSDTPHRPKNVPPPTYLEQKRAEAQAQYQLEMKYVNDNREELERLLEQDQKAMQAQVPGSLWEAMDQLRGIEPPKPAADSASTVPTAAPTTQPPTPTKA
ncbi:Mitochondrial import inner membrane translocase subunit TIM50 [Psilocybe cubensis]|uniref:Mitochondrial import inner membrane translocase subunit TIM50 n=2 Tax=Psilocybe cubensis TaxID=181762 RepID=A0ACB8HD53_PSICU|nr:Mitochondrial import inner membrane translocase subunit TIM50 [Psilocybe cubensis]KAH9485806.1 Mitochondrial import inner membrane translocase subunit TIM50 [Psilocybe cubensis]